MTCYLLWWSTFLVTVHSAELYAYINPMIIRIFTALLFICLSGCAMFQTPTAPVGQPMSWQTRAAKLQQIQAWQAHGSISIQHEDKTDLASMQWQQHQNHYQFTLFGPLGFGHVEIKGEPGLITLTQSNKPPVSATTPELLMQNQLGWQIPISYLYYWARGLPAPGIPAQKTFDAYHHLTKLKQANWEIEYSQYMTVNQVDLPRKMQLLNEKLKVKWVVKKWELHID
jgi:outer membrane lipoprotein LolB